MIDTQARREMAQLMRKFAMGGMTVNDFEKVAEELGDRDSSVFAAYMLAWHCYDDFKTETLTGKWRLPPETRRIWAKWVLFLMTSSFDYEGPSMTPRFCSVLLPRLAAWSLCLFNPFLSLAAMVTVHLAERSGVTERILNRGMKEESITEYWPFGSESEFRSATALRNPFAVAI